MIEENSSFQSTINNPGRYPVTKRGTVLGNGVTKQLKTL